MSLWSDFYVGRVGRGYSDYCKERYAPFIRELLSNNKDVTLRE